MKHCLIMTGVGFFSGMVMFSYLIPLVFFHVDIRRASADGNPGSSNVIRMLGVGVGLACMALDVGKAFLPVFISIHILRVRGFYLVPVTLAPVVGHAFSPLMRFQGGKAVSTTYGSLLGLIPLSFFVFVTAVLMAFFRFLVVVRPDSSGVIVSMAAADAAVLLWPHSPWLRMAVVLMSCVVIYRELRRPDGGPRLVAVGHYCIRLQDRRLVIEKSNT